MLFNSMLSGFISFAFFSLNERAIFFFVKIGGDFGGYPGATTGGAQGGVKLIK